jgi:hypothetical protein
MMIHVENFKDLVKQLSELLSYFSDFIGYKIIMQSQSCFYTKVMNHLKKNLRIPFFVLKNFNKLLSTNGLKKSNKMGKILNIDYTRDTKIIHS